MAFLKYMDAWSLSPENWELNLPVGRLLLLQGKNREALQHLQTALALVPPQAALRSDISLWLELVIGFLNSLLVTLISHFIIQLF